MNNKRSLRIPAVVMVILITLLFTNMIYAVNDNHQRISVEIKETSTGTNKVSGGDTITLEVSSQKEFEIKSIEFTIDGEVINNIEPDIHTEDGCTITCKLPDEIKTGVNDKIFEGYSGKLGYCILAEDSEKNEVTLETEEKNDIEYYKRLDLDTVACTVVNGLGKEILKERDSFSVKVRTSVPVEISKAELPDMTEGYKAVIEGDDSGMEWDIKYTLGRYDEDVENIRYTLYINDVFSEYQITKASNLGYLKPIQVNDLCITTSGYEGIYAKNGDDINVSFKVNKEADVKVDCNISSEEKSESLESDKDNNEKEWTYNCKFKLKNDFEKDNKKIVIKINISDKAGNKYSYTNSDFTYYQTIEDSLLTYKIQLKNKDIDRKYVNCKDRIKIVYASGHPVQLEETKIAGKNVKFTSDISKCKWEGILDLSTAGLDDEQQVTYSFKVTDKFGQEKVFTHQDKPAVIYYAPITKPHFSFKKTITKQNADLDKNKVKNGDEIKVSFTIGHPVDITAKMKMSSEKEIIFDRDTVDSGYRYEAAYVIEDGAAFDNQTPQLEIALEDEAGNIGISCEEDSGITYYAPLSETLKTFSADTSNANVNVAINGDTVTFTYENGHPVEIEEMMIAGNPVKCTRSQNGRRWKGSWVIKKGVLQDNTIVDCNLWATDRAGNYIQLCHDGSAGHYVTYAAPIEIKDLKMQSDNKEKNLAKAGDKITISFYTTHLIDIKKCLIKMSGSKQMEIVEDGNRKKDRYYYKAVCSLAGDRKFDAKRIGFVITAGDDAGNQNITVTQEDIKDTILYYKSISSSLRDIRFETSNSSKTLVKNNDSVTLSFRSSHPVMVKGSIAGKKAGFTSSDGGYSWSSTVTINSGMVKDNTPVDFSVDISDMAGNDKYSVNQESTGKIYYYAPVKINGLSMLSDNKSQDGHIAIRDDNVILNFYTTHPVNISEQTIAGQPVEFRTEDNMNWTAIYKVREGDTLNMSPIGLRFVVNDNAGNEPVVMTNQNVENVIYYAPIEISGLKISSNNIKDALKYAKDGDTIYVEFLANHEVYVKNPQIAGYDVVAETEKVSEIQYSIRLSYAIKNGDLQDSDVVGFHCLLEDRAGNDPVNISRDNPTVENQITYFAPVTADSAYVSDYKDGNFAKNGDTVTVTVSASHPVKAVDAVIAGRQAQVSGNDTDKLSLAYKIPDNESTIPEGHISFAYTIEDMAGNQFQAAQVSESAGIKSIIYDRTVPDVKVTGDNTEGAAYYGDTVKYSIEYTGTNIFEGGLSLLVNGKESIGDLKKQVIDDGYRIDIELENEDNYLINASCVDMAGNKATEDTKISVTIDRTAPQLKTDGIEKNQIFQSDFRLSDYLDIEEQNLKDMDCVLTDSEGSHDWDIQDEITGDGKKTVTMKMTDMAGNVSDTYVYEFYVDVTAPAMVIKDDGLGGILKNGKKGNHLGSGTTLSISLEKINVGEEPDKFTTLKLLHKDGKQYMDILDSVDMQEDGSYYVKIENDGQYVLQAQAVDSVGNMTELCEYDLMVGKSKWQKLKPFAVAAAVLAAAGIGGVSVFIFKKKRR